MQISVTKMDGMAIKTCGSDNHGVTVRDPSPGHSPMGLGRSLDLRWMENVAGGGIEVDDLTVCCNVLCTGVNKRKLSVASVWGKVPCKLQAVLCLDGGEQCEGGCGDVLVRFLYFRLLFLAEWMTGCTNRIIIIRLVATLFHRLRAAD